MSEPESMSRSPEPSTDAGRGRSRGRARGSSTGRGPGGRGHGRGSGRGILQDLPLEPEDLQWMQALQAGRIAYEDSLIGRMDLQASHQMIQAVLYHDPAYIFDLKLLASDGTQPVPGTTAGPSWCVCGRCREMPTDIERKCCGYQPDGCLSIMPHMDIYILMERHLRIARRLWNDLRAVQDSQDPGESNRQFRYAAYRQWVFGQHGSLGGGRRVVIPSCCVWRIRDRLPDPQRHYVGFIPSRF